MTFRIRNLTRNSVLAEKATQAASLRSRMKGLLGRKDFVPGEGLWIVPCSSIHTFFMKFPIDVVFVSRQDRVVGLYEDLAPFRLTRWISSSRAVLELPKGTLRKSSTALGDEVKLEASS